VFEAIAGYAKMLGLMATYFLGQQVMIVELYADALQDHCCSVAAGPYLRH
jgi:hypothetical protein